MAQIDARLDALLRRDPNGVYLPLTPEERTKHTKKFGPDEVQNAEAQIQRARDASDAKAQAAQKNALEAEKTRGALEIAKQQAAIAQQKANSEAEAAAADTERKRTTTNRIKAKQDASDTYDQGLTAQIAQGAQGPAALTGTALGIGAGAYIGNNQKKSIQEANAERQKAAAKVEKLNPGTASPSEYGSIYRGAKQAGLVPSGNPLGAIPRGVSRFAPYAGTAAAFGADAAVMRYLANKRDEDNMSPDSLKKDIMNDAGAIGVGGGLGTLGEGALYTLFPGAHPDAAALASIDLARQKAKELAANPNPPQGQLPPADTRQLPPPRPYSGAPAEQIREIGKALGYDPTGKEGKTRSYKGALDALEEAEPHHIDYVHARIPNAAAEDDAVTAIRKHLARLHEAKSPIGGKAGILAALGLGAGAAVAGSGEAEAAPIDSAMRTAKRQTEAPAEEESDLAKEFGTGFPLRKARQAAKDVADVGSYQVPVVGEARMAVDAPNAYKPSDEDLADAEYWQRGREEMAKPKAPAQPEQGDFAKGGEVEFNPEHLPEHERALIGNPHEAIERASWQLPYLAAGRHMVNLTGDPDTFFGGKTPEHEEAYQNALRASKAFYDNAFKHLASKASPHSTPDQPVAPEAETAPEKFKHGGAVNKKVTSIASGFEAKLKTKERAISSLEKAYEKHPTPQMRKRIAEERELADRIKRHIGKVKSYA